MPPPSFPLPLALEKRTLCAISISMLDGEEREKKKESKPEQRKWRNIQRMTLKPLHPSIYPSLTLPYVSFFHLFHLFFSFSFSLSVSLSLFLSFSLSWCLQEKRRNITTWKLSTSRPVFCALLRSLLFYSIRFPFLSFYFLFPFLVSEIKERKRWICHSPAKQPTKLKKTKNKKNSSFFFFFFSLFPFSLRQGRKKKNWKKTNYKLKTKTKFTSPPFRSRSFLLIYSFIFFFIYYIWNYESKVWCSFLFG